MHSPRLTTGSEKPLQCSRSRYGQLLMVLGMIFVLIGNVNCQAKIPEEASNANHPAVKISSSVKHELKEQPPTIKATAAAASEAVNNIAAQKEIAKSNEAPAIAVEKADKTGSKDSKEPTKDNKTPGKIQSSTSSDSGALPSASDHPLVYHKEESSIFENEDDLPDSIKAVAYFFAALSVSAIAFIVFKFYRLRLTRAERKYGVQGDRSTQELTPLPIAIEDGHSDDEDQTLFDVQRQNIRIL